jgi:hypothetical protein
VSILDLGVGEAQQSHQLFSLAAHQLLESQEDIISELKVGLARAHEKIEVLEMSSALVRMRVVSLEDVMESTLTPTNLTLDDSDSDYTNVNDGGAMMVEDSEDERENVPPLSPILPRRDTPHPAPVFCSLIPIEDPVPTPAVEVVDVDAEGEDDTWYIPPIHCCWIHPLDKFTTVTVEPVPEYVEDRREDELWANLGVNLRSCPTE